MLARGGKLRDPLADLVAAGALVGGAPLDSRARDPGRDPRDDRRGRYREAADPAHREDPDGSAGFNRQSPGSGPVTDPARALSPAGDGVLPGRARGGDLDPARD